MAEEFIDIRVRLQDAQHAISEANRVKGAIHGVGSEVGTAGARARTANEHIGGFRKGIGGIGGMARGSIGGIKGLAGAVGLFAVGSWMKSSVDQTEKFVLATRKLSISTGMDLKTSSEWVAAAQGRGIEVKKLQMGFGTLEKQMHGATTGGKKQAEAFSQLGVSMDTVKSGNVQETLMQVTDGLKNMKNPADRMTLASQLFGRAGKDLLPTLVKGRVGIQEMLDVYAKYGAVVDKEGMAKTLKFVNAQHEFQAATLGLKMQIGIGLMPTLTKLMGVATKVIAVFSGPGSLEEKFKKAGDIIKPLGNEMARTFDKVAPILITHIANMAPKLAKRFVQAFMGASTWGQIAIGGYLLTKFGVTGAIGKGMLSAGGRMAKRFGARYIPWMATEGVAGGAAAAGPKGLGSTSGKFGSAGTRSGKAFGKAFAAAAILGLFYLGKAGADALEKRFQVHWDMGGKGPLGIPLPRIWFGQFGPGKQGSQEESAVAGGRATPLPGQKRGYGGDYGGYTLSPGRQPIGGASGGLITKHGIKGYGSGGVIGGTIPRGEDTIIGARFGEFMLKKPTVDAVGVPALTAINEHPQMITRRSVSTIDPSIVRGAVPQQWITKVYLEKRQIAEAVADTAADAKARA